DLFNGNVLHEIRIVVHPKDWATLKQDYLGNEVYAADFHWLYNGRDIYEPGVSIRSRGQGSRSPIKPSLRVEFDRYESHNTFLGLQNLVLRANTQDASMMHERIAMELFRRMGIPAPREAHTRLYVNGQYAGLYTIVEEVDEPFVQRNFGQSGGYLYNFDYKDTWVFEYRGSNPEEYSPLPFKPENHFENPDPEPIVSMVAAINQPGSSAQFLTAVSQYVDWDNFLREIAAENFVADQDGIIGNYGVNNMFFYRLENQLKSFFIPWDKSNAFWSLDWPILHNVNTDVLSVRALAIPELMAKYRGYLQQAADLAGGAGGWLEQEITKVYQQIRQAAYDDKIKLCDPGASGTLKPCSDSQFDAEYQFMINFARTRATSVRAQLSQQ